MHNLYDDNCANSLFELKESNTSGHNFAVKQNYQEPALGKIDLSLWIGNLWSNLPVIVVEAPSTDTIKNRFDRHCRERNLLFDVDIDCTNVHTLST